MATRLLAGGLLLASAIISWLTINIVLAARLLQAVIGLSVLYVAYLAWRGGRAMRGALRHEAARSADAGAHAEGLPFVSLVIPAKDEAAVIGDAIRDMAAQDYTITTDPRFEVLVVDDGSRDGTGEVARNAAAGRPHVRVMRRERGDGPATKGAALAFAQPHLAGEVVGVVDADTRVEHNFLGRAMRAWERDPTAAALQARRQPRNETRSWLTRAQAEEQLMDLASQCGRWETHGNAELRGNGMFVRCAALGAAGGWAADALTEDLELSTRLAAAGAHVTMAPEASVGEEAVETLGDLWRQRLRWAEGSLRRLMLHGPRLLAGPQPLARKADFIAFTAEFLVPPLFVGSTIASLITIPLPRAADWTVPVSLFIGYGIGTFLLALVGLAAVGRRGPALVASAVRGALFLSHWLVVVPAALIKIAIGPESSTFVKTRRAGRSPDR